MTATTTKRSAASDQPSARQVLASLRALKLSSSALEVNVLTASLTAIMTLLRWGAIAIGLGWAATQASGGNVQSRRHAGRDDLRGHIPHRHPAPYRPSQPNGAGMGPRRRRRPRRRPRDLRRAGQPVRRLHHGRRRRRRIRMGAALRDLRQRARIRIIGRQQPLLHRRGHHVQPAGRAGIGLCRAVSRHLPHQPDRFRTFTPQSSGISATASSRPTNCSAL